jgi:RNA polymerase sigma factor (sigma-70 family)
MIFNKRKYLKDLDDVEILLLYKKEQWSLCIDELFLRYGHLIYGVFLKYVNDKDEAADLLMELFGKLPQLLIQHDILQLRPWLHTVARNEALQHIRKGTKNTHVSFDALSMEPVLSNQNNGDQIEEVEGLEDQLQLLEKVIWRLKPDQEICIRLFFMEQLSYEQIMSKTQFSFKEVKSHLQNGKRNLKILMEQNQNNESN